MRRTQKLFIAALLFMVLPHSLGAEDKAQSFVVRTDAEGGYVYEWAGERVAFAWDADGDLRAELVTFLWGVKSLRSMIDLDHDDQSDLMAIFSADGQADFYLRENGHVYRPERTDDRDSVSKAKEILKASLIRRIAIDDGSAPQREIGASEAPKIVESGPAPSADSPLEEPLTIILFPARPAEHAGMDAKPRVQPTPPKPRVHAGRRPDAGLPIRFPDVKSTIGQPDFIDLPDLQVPIDPFDETRKTRASARFALFRYRVEAPPPSPLAEPRSERGPDRLQICAHVRIQGERDDRFCVEQAFPPQDAGALITSAPGTDLAAPRAGGGGSWLIEVHRHATGR